jgi:hydroxypyruvate reductase
MITGAERTRHALQIFRAALDAADPARAILAHLRLAGRTLIAGDHRYALSDFDRIQVIGAGKAGAKMAAAVERLLGRRVSGGIVNVPPGTKAYLPLVDLPPADRRRIELRHIDLNQSGHPDPDRRGLAGARRIAEIAGNVTGRDLLICLISGGASALLADPAPPVTLSALRQTTRQLLDCGATIHEVNTVRKHISWLKGGQLARLAAPAAILALILSDVVGDDLNVIGSAPTVPDPSTFADAAAVFEKYGIRAHSAVRKRIDAGLAGRIAETPKPGDPAFARVRNVIVGNNRAAIDRAARRARELGYRPLVLSTFIEGETRDVASMHAAIVKEILASGRPARPPVCVLSGGETTVTIRDQKGRAKGQGGRNQEFVLAAAIALYGSDDRFGPATIFSAGSDGIDGPTDAAGAIADERTIARARQLNLDPRRFLDGHDSYRFFNRIGTLLRTGPTGTNVMDVRIILIPARAK